MAPLANTMLLAFVDINLGYCDLSGAFLPRSEQVKADEAVADSWEDADADDEDFSAGCPQIHSLSLASTPPYLHTTALLRLLSDSLPLLSHLNIARTFDAFTGPAALLCIAGRFINLLVLDVSQNEWVNDRSVQGVRWEGCLMRLREMRVRGCAVSDSCVRESNEGLLEGDGKSRGSWKERGLAETLEDGGTGQS
ncbi:hypothetical protein HK101_010697 [Irineochytrium annulatum]|nr:hypothetical protein HK101_010697 [Irineochytrium annulatum]